MRRRPAQLAMTAVLFVLGILAVAQFNAQKEPEGGPGKTNPDDHVVPYAARARVPIFSIPLGRRR